MGETEQGKMTLDWTLNVRSEEELAETAREKYKEEPEQVKQAVAELQNWIQKNPHLENIRADSQFLLFFLRGSGHSVEKTKQGLDLYFSVKSNLPEWFSGWDPTQSSIQSVLSAGIFLPLPGYDRKGRQVFLVRFGAIQTGSMKVDTLYRASIMLLELALEGNNQAAVSGIVVIHDMAGVTVSHTLMMTPSTMKKHIVLFQDAYPMDNMALIESSAMHHLNMHKIVKALFTLMLSHSKEIYKRMNHVHKAGKTDALVEDLGPEVLPAEYGGSGGSVEEITQYWIQETQRHKDWFARMETYRTDESKRPGGGKTTSDLFGILGSFRKLEID